MEAGTAKRRWSVGELAGTSGLTVRALHYYDEIGLVVPSERTAAGHRRYTGADVRRLHQVRALLRLGLSLEDVSRVLADPAAARALLTAQLAELDAAATRIDAARDRVRDLLDTIESGRPDAEQLLAVLEQSVPLVDAGAYFSPAQLDALARGGTVEDLKDRWLALLARGRELVRTGVPATDPRARALAVEWREIGTALRGDTAGDDGIDAAAAALWRDRARDVDQGFAERVSWLDVGDLAAVVGYVRAAAGPS